MRGGRAEEDSRQPRPRSGASWRFLEFGLPPLVFLAVVFRIVTHPASPAALVTFVTAAAAALAAEAFTFPMDALKAGVQVRGSRTGDTGGGASMSWFQYVGLLYYGLRAALMRTIPYTGMRMTMYMVFKNMGGGAFRCSALTIRRNISSHQRGVHGWWCVVVLGDLCSVHHQ